jgi:hypothetical protein
MLTFNILVEGLRSPARLSLTVGQTHDVMQVQVLLKGQNFRKRFFRGSS